MEELIRVAEEKIITDDEEDLTKDKLKNAAATKRLAVFDAFDIIDRIEQEKQKIEAAENPEKEKEEEKDTTFRGFAERRKK